MSCYPEPNSHIRSKVKVVLELTNYATKKELDHAPGVDTSDLAAKKGFIALKAEVDKLNINKLTNVPTSLNNLKAKVDDLDVGKLKTVPVDLKKLSNVVDNEVVKNIKLNILKTEVNSLGKKIPDTTTLIHINQYNTDKQNLEKKIRDVDKKVPDTSGLVTTTVLNTKISEVQNKIPDTSGLVATTVLNTKISEVENKIPSVSGLVKKTDYDAKTKDIEGKYFTTADDYNKFTSNMLHVKIKQRKLVNKSDIDKKLINIRKLHIEAGKKLTDLTKKVPQLSEKGYDFLLGRMYFTGNDGYQNFLVFAPILSSIILYSNIKVTDWMSTRISSEKIKPFDTGLELTMSNLANGRVNLKFNNSVLVQKSVSFLK